MMLLYGAILIKATISLNLLKYNKNRMESFETKNIKITNLLQKKKDNTFTNYYVSVINLSNNNLRDSEYNQLKIGLTHCFINEDKHTKKNISTDKESLDVILVSCLLQILPLKNLGYHHTYSHISQGVIH